MWEVGKTQGEIVPRVSSSAEAAGGEIVPRPEKDIHGFQGFIF